MDTPIVNRVAESGIITLNLEQYFPQQNLAELDLAEYLFQGLILREKDFRLAMKEYDWSLHKDEILCVYCSKDAIIPVWAYMLVAASASVHTHDIYQGTTDEYLKYHYQQIISNLNPEDYSDARVVIKGCSNRPVPPSAYASITALLRPHAKSIMYGEPCSTVPIFKKPLKRVR